MKSLFYVSSVFLLLFFLSACDKDVTKPPPPPPPETESVCGTFYVQPDFTPGQESCSEGADIAIFKNAYVSGFTGCFGKLNEIHSYQTINDCEFNTEFSYFDIDAEMRLVLEDNEEVGISFHYNLLLDGTSTGKGTFQYGTGKFKGISGSINTIGCPDFSTKGCTKLDINGKFCTDN